MLVALQSGVPIIFILSCVESARFQVPVEGKPSTKTPTTLRLKEANAKCKWSFFRCKGEGCQWRPLPLDHRLSQSCRITDDHMLRDEKSAVEFIELYANLLSERAETFQSNCANVSSQVGWLPGSRWLRKSMWHCLRHVGYMVRASGLLMAAKTKIKDLGQLSKLSLHQLEAALLNLATAFGSDGHYVLEMVKKFKAKPTRVTQDIKTSLTWFVDILFQLAGDNEDEKQVARENIVSLPTEVPKPTPDDVARLVQATQELPQKNASVQLDGLVAASTEVTKDNIEEAPESMTELSSYFRREDEIDDDEPDEGAVVSPSGINRLLQLPLKVNWMLIMAISIVFSLTFVLWLWPTMLGAAGIATVEYTGWFGLPKVGFGWQLLSFIPSYIISSFFNKWQTAAHLHQDPDWTTPMPFWTQIQAELEEGGGGYKSRGIETYSPSDNASWEPQPQEETDNRRKTHTRKESKYRPQQSRQPGRRSSSNRGL